MSAPDSIPLLSGLSPYVYGTTRLGDGSIPFEDRVAIARRAMDAKIWFHTSHQYGNALEVLRAAFDQDRASVPPAIFKIGWDSIPQIREQIAANIEPLGIPSMAIGQLCLGGVLGAEFRSGGACYDGFRALKEEGLVGRFVLEVWPWNSEVPLEAFRAGYPDGVVDGLIFYLNPLQRFVSNELWDLIDEKNIPVIAMRTVCGGSAQRLIDSEKAPEYLRKRAAQIQPIFERSGCASWTEFCVRYASGFAPVRTTVGSTSREANLQEFLDATKSVTPLASEIQAEIVAHQRDWYTEHDQFAAPWSM